MDTSSCQVLNLLSHSGISLVCFFKLKVFFSKVTKRQREGWIRTRVPDLFHSTSEPYRWCPRGFSRCLEGEVPWALGSRILAFWEEMAGIVFAFISGFIKHIHQILLSWKGSQGSEVYGRMGSKFSPPGSSPPNLLFFFFFFFFFSLWAAPAAHQSSQARGWIRAAGASLHHSHGNVGSELCLWRILVDTSQVCYRWAMTEIPPLPNLSLCYCCHVLCPHRGLLPFPWTELLFGIRKSPMPLSRWTGSWVSFFHLRKGGKRGENGIAESGMSELPASLDS